MTLALTTAIDPAGGPLSGSVRVPGDKSIAQRAALLAAVASGRSVLRSYPASEDARAALRVVHELGVEVDHLADDVTIEGRGWAGLRPPERPISCVRSGTAMRLAAGLLAGAGVPLTLTGEPQLLGRPMERVAAPLRAMGADVSTTDGRPPITLLPRPLHGIRYQLPVASAQVKSAVLLAGLRADGDTTVVEPTPTRDHTERLLRWVGVEVGTTDGITVRRSEIPAFELRVPGDPSSAAVLLAAAAIIPRSDIVVEDVCVNPTRMAFVELLRRMGADVSIEPTGVVGPEPAGRIRLRSHPLGAVTVGPGDVPGLIDELPLVAVLGAFADGVTEVRGAGELRVKESDRIGGLVGMLRSLGVDIAELPDGFAVRGPSLPDAGRVDGRGDHRLAMALAVVALGAPGPVSIGGMAAVDDSFPRFLGVLDSLR